MSPSVPLWQSRAACAGQTDVMYDEDRVDEAKAVCAICPVAARCALAAVRRHERYGVWGGFAAAEREALVRGVRRRAS
jgi:WhiB family redox-sensing transcriptional regulator